MDAATRQIMFSSGTDDWQTPPEFFRQQHARHAFTIDGAADGTNHLLPRWWGPGSPERIDALSTEPWPTGARIWINPPYSRVQKDFIARAAWEVDQGRVDRVVMLLPARTDTKVFHDYIWDRERRQPYDWVREVDFVKGRLTFGTAAGAAPAAAPFPSMVVWVQLPEPSDI